jgi:competence protein ComEA
MKKLLLLLSLLLPVNVFATPVDINTADVKTIADSLEGIGKSKAEAIVKYREEHGYFKNVDELNNVSGIGDKLFEKIKNDIQLGGVEPPVVPTPAPVVPTPAVEPKK